MYIQCILIMRNDVVVRGRGCSSVSPSFWSPRALGPLSSALPVSSSSSILTEEQTEMASYRRAVAKTSVFWGPMLVTSKAKLILHGHAHPWEPSTSEKV